MSKFNWVALNRNYEDIIYETYDGIAKITINRPEVRNAFRPKTVVEMIDAFSVARDDTNVGVIILTGANHGKGEDKEAFCSGGDQKVRGNGGYVGEDQIPRLNVLDLQHLIRITPKPVIAMVNGFAIGGGHVLHIVCDLTIASENAKLVRVLVLLMLVMVLVYLPLWLGKRKHVKYGSSAVNILPKKQWTWEWLILLFHLTVLKKKPFNGPKKCLPSHQWHFVCSKVQ